jgi:hypothetical protein
MAFRTWARILLAALGVAALAGASQLGVGYGLGIVRLTRIFDAAGRDQWHAQLAWVAWFAMVAAVVGGLAGGRFHQRWAPATTPASGAEPTLDDSGATRDLGSVTPSEQAASPSVASPAAGLWTRVAIAVAAGLGATAVVPLTMQPARTAMIDAVDAGVVIGICAGLGALVGVFAAYAALSHVVARWSFGALIGAVWLLAVISVVPSLGPDDALPSVRLGVFDAGFLAPATTQRFALFTMPAVALLAGALLGWAARRREFTPFTIAFAGLPGPALIMAAYLIAGPGDGGQRYQVVPYWAAMAAVGTGVLGAVIAALIRRGTQDDSAEDPSAVQGEAPAMPPLPRRRTGQTDTPAADSPTDAAHTDPARTNAARTNAARTDVPATIPPPIGEPVPRPYESGSFAGPLLAAGSRPGPFPPSLATPRDSDSYLDPADFQPAASAPARDQGGAVKRGFPGFGRSRTPKAASDPSPGTGHSAPGLPAPGLPAPGLPAPGLPAPPSLGRQPHQVSPPLPHPTPLTPPVTPPHAAQNHPAQNQPAQNHQAQNRPAASGPHPAALPHLVAPAYPAVPAQTPRGGFGPQATPSAPAPTSRKNAAAESFDGPADVDRPGRRAADREDPSGRRPARGADAPVRKKDEDFVDWVSGLGND